MFNNFICLFFHIHFFSRGDPFELPVQKSNRPIRYDL